MTRLEEYVSRAALHGLTNPLHRLHFPLMRECIANNQQQLAQLLANAIMVTIERYDDQERLVISYYDRNRKDAEALARRSNLGALQMSITTLLGRNLDVAVLI